MLSKELQEEYLKWLKDNGKAKYELTNIVAWNIKTSPEDFAEFCKIKDINYEDVKIR
jgi:hypothetical protein